MSEVIVVTSGKGGVGKTTSTANIGTGLARMNKKVVLIDTDIGLRNLDVEKGPTMVFTICEKDEVEAVYAYCNLHGLWKA